MGKYAVARWLDQMSQFVKQGLRDSDLQQQSIVNEMIRYHPLAKRLQSALSQNHSVLLLYFDIVKMKEIEERVGEEIAAKLIRALEEAIDVCLHAAVPKSSILSIENFWADDFIVCISKPDVSDQHAYELTTALRKVVTYQFNQVTTETFGLKVDLHVGYAILYHDRGRLDKQLYIGIKQAMRMAKKGNDIRSNLLYGEFQTILAKREVRSHFQPIVELNAGQVIGWEALTRGPQGSYFERPDILFARAEEFDDLYSLEKICRETAISSLQKLSRNQKLFLNMNPKMVDDARFESGRTKELLGKRGIEPDQIVFEITERDSIRDFSSFRRALNHYRDQGYLIAVDDVGAGYSNLQSIVELAPDFIKMDMSLIRNIDRDPVRQAILDAFVTIANKTNCKLLAEGIETEEELRMVKRLGVHLGQGFLLGRPEAKQKYEVESRALTIVGKKTISKIQSSGTTAFTSIGEISSRTFTVTRQTTVRTLHELFEQQRDVSCVVVVADCKPVGLVTRQHLFRKLGWRYGVPLYFNRTVEEIMDDTPLMLDYGMPIEQAAAYATDRGKQKMYDDVIVLDGDQYYGVVAVHQILQAMSQMQIELAKYANSLTGLPGNVRIDEELRHRLKMQSPFDVVYADLNTFKAFNDQFGFERGDRLILLTARILQRCIKECKVADGFVGHIGGDDFIMIMDSADGKHVSEAVIRQFERVKYFLKRKEKESKDQAAVSVSIALASLSCNPLLIQNHLQISEQAAELKKVAKQYRGSTLVSHALDGALEVKGNLEKRSPREVR